MLILQVELENIKSYEQALVEFAPGVNAIVGHNGAGKSTLIEAIGFALFDSLTYKASDFLRAGARTGTVAVTFIGSMDERPYRVERRLGGSHLYVVYDVELQAKLCEGKVDVLAFVRRQLGADATVDLSRLFADAIGVPQGTLTAAFLQQPSQRKTIFDALLQVDEYRTAVEKLREPRTLLLERQQALAQESAVLAARLERLPQLESAVWERTEELRSVEQTTADLRRRLESIQARKNELDALRAQVDKFSVERARQGERTKTMVAQAAEAERLVAEAEQARATVQANQQGHDRYAEAQHRRVELDQTLRQRHRLREERATADKLAALAQSELARLGEQIARITAAEQQVLALTPAVAQQAQLEQALAEAQKERARQQEVARRLEIEQKRLQQLEEQAQKLVRQLDQAETVQQEVQTLEQQIAALRERVTQYSGEQGTLQANATELKRQNEALESVQTAQCPVCEQPLSPEHRERMLARNAKRLQELRQAYATLQTSTRQADAGLKEAVNQHKRLLDTQRTLPRADELQETQQRIAQALAAVQESQAAQTALQSAEQRAAALGEELAQLQDPRQQRAVAAQQAGERAAVEARGKQLAQQQAQAAQQLATVDQALAALEGLDADMAAVERSLQEHQAAFQAVLSFRRQADALSERHKQRDELLTAQEQAQKALAEVEGQLASVSAKLDPGEYTGILSEDQMLRGEVGGMQARRSLLEQEQVRSQAEITALQAQQAELEELEAAQRKLRSQADALEAVRSLLKQSGPYITQALIRQISSAATQIFGELMQDFSRLLCWNEDYGITLEVEGTTRQFLQLSGGEQMSAALAVRLALVREISNIDIAFFDEPTANLDGVRREALAHQVMHIKGFRQLFVISHDDTFEQITQNLVRVKRHGSSSIIAAVES